MTGAHVIEDLCFEVDFASEDAAFEAQERLMRFAQERAQTVIAEVFDESVDPDVVLRLERLEVDVGTVAVGDFEERFAERLREVLREVLRERRMAPTLGMSRTPHTARTQQTPPAPSAESPTPLATPIARMTLDSVDALTTGPRAELEWLLHFIEYGFLPWHAPARIGRDIQALAARVLERNGVELARALRAVPVAQWHVIFRRLVAQFPAQWLARLGRHIGLARRGASEAFVTEMEVPPTDTGVAGTDTGVAGTDTGVPARARRARIESLLSESGVSDVARVPSAAVATETWRGVLRDDAPWLKETLLRLGGAMRVRRRLAEVLPEEVVADVFGLWLGPAQVDIVIATIGARNSPALTAPLSMSPSAISSVKDVVLASLTYILVEGGARGFNEASYRRSMASQIVRDGKEALGREGVDVKSTLGSRLGAGRDKNPTTVTGLNGADVASMADTLSAAGAASMVGSAGTVSAAVKVGAAGTVGSASTVGAASTVDAAGTVGAASMVSAAGTVGAVSTVGAAGKVGAVDASGAADVANVSAIVNAADMRSPLYDAARLQADGEPVEISAVASDMLAAAEIPRAIHTAALDELHDALDGEQEALGGLHDVLDGPHNGPPRSRARAQIEAVLGESTESDFTVIASVPVAAETWRRVLRDDAPWLKETLLRLGRGIRARRRLAAAVPEEVVAEVLGLWLGPAQVDIVLATIDVSTSPPARTVASMDAPCAAIRPARLLATLTYILVDGGALEFSESGYRRSLANQTARSGDGALDREGGAVAPTPGSRLRTERHEKPTTVTGLSGADAVGTAATIGAASVASTVGVAGAVDANDAVGAADVANASAILNAADLRRPLYDATRLQVDGEPVEISAVRSDILAAVEIPGAIHTVVRDELREAPGDSHDGLDGPHEALGGSRDGIDGSREALSGSRDGIDGPHEALGGSRDGIDGPHEALGGSHDGLDGPHEALGGSHVGLDGPHEALGGSRDGIDGPHEALSGSRDGIDGPHEALGGSRDGIDGPRDRPDGAHDGLARSQARALIEALVSESPESNFGRLALTQVTIATWRSVLRNDATWLKSTLVRLGRGIRVRRRIATVVPQEVVSDLLALWLSAAQVETGLATIGAGAQLFTGEMGNTDASCEAIKPAWLLATLTYILVDGGALEFSELGYRRSLANQTDRGVDEAAYRDGIFSSPLPGGKLSVGKGGPLRDAAAQTFARSDSSAPADQGTSSDAHRRSHADTIGDARLGSFATVHSGTDLKAATTPDSATHAMHYSGILSGADPKLPNAAHFQDNSQPMEVTAGRSDPLADSEVSGVTDTVALSDEHDALARSRSRAQIEVLLSESPESVFPVVASIPVIADTWRSVLHDDAPWLKATLLRLGRGVRVRRRLAAALATEIVADVLALWLSPAQVDVVFATIGVGTAPFIDAMANTDAQREAISAAGLLATLTYILTEGGDREFSESGYRSSLANQTVRDRDDALPYQAISAGAISDLRPSVELRDKTRGSSPSPRSLAAPNTPTKTAPASTLEYRATAAPVDQGAHPDLQLRSGAATTSDACPERSETAQSDTDLTAVATSDSVARATAQSEILPEGKPVLYATAHFAAGSKVIEVTAASPSTLRGSEIPRATNIPRPGEPSETRANLQAPAQSFENDATQLISDWHSPVAKGSATGERSHQLPDVTEALNGHCLVPPTAAQLRDDVERDMASARGVDAGAELSGQTTLDAHIQGAPSRTADQSRVVTVNLARPLVIAQAPVGLAPAPAAFETTPADLTPAPKGLALARAGLELSPADLAPTPADFAPTLAGLAPTPADLAPTPAGLTPTPAGLVPTPAGLTPTPEGLAPRPADLVPAPASLATAPLALAPTPSGPALATTARTPTPPDPPPATPTGLTDSTHGASQADATLAAFGTGPTPHGVDLLRHLRGAPTPNSPADALRRALRALLNQRPAAARDALRSALEYPGAGRRLAGLLAVGDLAGVLQWLRPSDGAMVLAIAARVSGLGQDTAGHTVSRLDAARSVLSTPGGLTDTGNGTRSDNNTHTAANPLAHVVNEFLLTEIFEEGRTLDPERLAQRLTATLDAALASRGKPTQRARSGAVVAGGATIPEDAAVNQRIYIANAGVVIVGPYLPRLFSMLGLTNKESFTSLSSAHRAVHLIQYIVTGATFTPEPMLVLNKILCGLPISAPIPLDIDLRPQEHTAIEEMLAAIIAHWKAIGRTSIAGLRESFLQREGRIVSSDETWRLRVESKCFDMLLDRLPWGYAMVKYPWMKRVLHVDWR